MGGPVFSSLPLLSTPDTTPEAPNSGSNRVSGPSGLGNQIQAMTGGPVRLTRKGQAAHAGLLPTVTANLSVNGGSQPPSQRRRGGHGVSLADAVEH